MNNSLFKKLSRIFSTVLLSIMAFSFVGCGGEGQTPPPAQNEGDNNQDDDEIRDIYAYDAYEYSIMNIAGTDSLGRQVKVAGEKRADDIYVGMWYSFWEGQHPSLQREIYNITQLQAEGKEEYYTTNKYNTTGQFFWWGEPLYGYYSMLDPYVVTRHIELFVQAGIDFLCVDCTNLHCYPEVGEQFLTILRTFKQQGFAVPKICFYTNTDSQSVVDKIYKAYYQAGKWNDLWFMPNGKPVIVGITQNNNGASDQTKYHGYTGAIDSKYQNYFEVKESQWPNGNYNANGMPWMSWEYPQKIHNGYIAVPVAQHDHAYANFSTMAPESHRGYNNLTGVVDSDYKSGQSFQQMWDTVFDNIDDVSTVFVCCWNEWIAQKHYDDYCNGFFPDAFTQEYSRDIEMMKGGYGDNYYMQLVKNVREFKFEAGENYFDYTKNTIDIQGDEAQWDGLSHYKDYAGDAIVRNFQNCNNSGKYVDNSARNDFTDIYVTHDDDNVYIRIQTKDDITAYNGTDVNWMNVLISTGNEKSFEGYDYIIGRTPRADVTSVEKSTGGYQWTSVGDANYYFDGNEMVIEIPLSMLDLTAENCQFQFKVADHVTKYSDIMDYYVSGDCAPLGRLNFAYGY